MKYRQILSLILAAVFCSAAFSSCLRPEGSPAETGRTEESVPSDLSSDTPAGGVGDTVSPAAASEELGTVEEVEVLSPVGPASEPDANADFYPDGIFIYGDAVYTQSFFYEQYAKIFAQTALYYRQHFGCRVSVVVAPLSSMTIDNPKITSIIPSQKEVLSQMAPLFDPSVNYVNPYDKLDAHRNDYLFFRTDHHWTQRGAYYAYTAFCDSVGFTPTPLDGFTHTIISDNYAGSMYDWTKDEKVKSFHDVIEAFHTKKKLTMTVDASWGEHLTFDDCIIDDVGNYVSFLYGDHPFISINVPENSQDLVCAVLKDSFGNAFVPFLCEHYGTVIVIDPRYYSGNLDELFRNYNLTDIIFVNNVEQANSIAWPRLYMSCVGVELP